ncbi:MAG: hypothetical protein ACYCX4_07250 [Bacillota bacterium]
MAKDQTKKTKMMTRLTKGEMVQDPQARGLTASEEIILENPYKTPPNNMTTKGDRGGKA